MSKRRSISPFYKQLEQAVKELGGLHNAHLHLDRAGTLAPEYLQGTEVNILEDFYISLHKKHCLVANLHSGPAYEPEDLRSRVNAYLDAMIEVGTVKADTMVDVTADNVGLSALEILLDIKAEKSAQINLNVAAYTPLGFEDAHPENWDIYVEGAKQSDFIGSLPERDDTDDFPNSIGFYENCRRSLELAKELNKSIHVHTDQRNEPSEKGTEELIRSVREFGAPDTSNGKEPSVWAVHAISPSTYDEDRFDRMVAGLIECNIGIICCPSAALGMRQLRPLMTPTYNSIPRILEMLAAGVHIRLGSDNIADICSPSTTEDLYDEIFILSAALRFYDAGILAKLAAGVQLNENDRDFIKHHLKKNSHEISKTLDSLKS